MLECGDTITCATFDYGHSLTGARDNCNPYFQCLYNCKEPGKQSKTLCWNFQKAKGEIKQNLKSGKKQGCMEGSRKVYTHPTTPKKENTNQSLLAFLAYNLSHERSKPRI